MNDAIAPLAQDYVDLVQEMLCELGRLRISQVAAELSDLKYVPQLFRADKLVFDYGTHCADGLKRQVPASSMPFIPWRRSEEPWELPIPVPADSLVSKIVEKRRSALLTLLRSVDSEIAEHPNCNDPEFIVACLSGDYFRESLVISPDDDKIVVTVGLTWVMANVPLIDRQV